MPALDLRLASVLALAACGATSPATGAERGPCQPGGGCDPGLQCLSQVCVEVAGTRCELVGRQAAAVLTDALRRRPLLSAMVGGAEVAPAVTAACRADEWPTAIQRCVVAARDHDQLEACLARLPAGARTALADRFARPQPGAALTTTTTTAAIPTTATTTPPLALTAGQLGPQCEQYLSLLARYGRCDKLPPEAQASITSAAGTARQSFLTVPVASRHLLEDGCRQAVGALQGALGQLGCS